MYYDEISTRKKRTTTKRAKRQTAAVDPFAGVKLSFSLQGLALAAGFVALGTALLNLYGEYVNSKATDFNWTLWWHVEVYMRLLIGSAIISVLALVVADRKLQLSKRARVTTVVVLGLAVIVAAIVAPTYEDDIESQPFAQTPVSIQSAQTS